MLDWTDKLRAGDLLWLHPYTDCPEIWIVLLLSETRGPAQASGRGQFFLCIDVAEEVVGVQWLDLEYIGRHSKVEVLSKACPEWSERG